MLVYFGAVDLFMPASEFSLQDLTSKWFGTLKPARMEVVPILFDGPMTSISSDSAKNGESQVLNNKVSGHKNSFVGLFVGRFVPNKGVELLIDVIQKWHTKKSQETEKKIILIVAGKVTPGFEFYFEELQAKIKFLGLNDCIHFTIDPSQDVLKRHFAEADFFICASRHEGFCMPIIEAQMAGLPVIALNSTAVPETMGLGGLVVEQGKDQIEDFCARIEEVLTNPELRLKLVQSGKENLARFDSSKVGAKFLGLLNV
ncbi:MAG: glycosyltransferase family 4 protein [Proteobacteria bacterium]|nr:glycosyltransferase family 4 protein [Pseudomonadota bacterium]